VREGLSVSIKLMTQVWEIQLPLAEKVVLMALADHAHDDGTGAKPGVPYLAWKTDCSDRTVQRALATLEALKLIRPIEHEKGGWRYATGYTLSLDNAPRKPPLVLVKGRQSVTPVTRKGVTDTTRGVTPATERGDTHDENPAAPPFTEPLEDNHHEPGARAPRETPDLDADFAESFWNPFPKRNGQPKPDRAKCLAKWRKYPEATRALIRQALPNYIAICGGPQGRFPKDPITWLNQNAWNDYLEKPDQSKPHQDGSAPKPSTPFERTRAAFEQARREDGLIP
jgi:hypothetical protein